MSGDNGEWTYYAVYTAPEFTAENPDTVVRRHPRAPRHEAQRLVRNGSWESTDVLHRIWLGQNHAEASAITRDQAARFARSWVAERLIPVIPGDLTEGRRGRGRRH